MKLPRIIHDPAEVDEILKDRAWGMSMKIRRTRSQNLKGQHHEQLDNK